MGPAQEECLREERADPEGAGESGRAATGETAARPLHGLLGKLVMLKPGEGPALLWSAGYFFFVLLSYYLLRPVREAMGVARGADKLVWLMTGTLVVMLAANPLFSALVSKYPRRKFIPLAYRFFGLNMLIFFGLFFVVKGPGKVWMGYAFYIWLSVFNLFVVSVFRAFMADIYDRGQAKRLFGFIGVGGTLGAIVGAFTAAALVKGSIDVPWLGGAEYVIRLVKLEPETLLLVAVVPLELSLVCVRMLGHWQRNTLGESAAAREPGPGVFKGLELIAKSRYLQLMCGYMLLLTMTSTFLYLEQGRIIEATYPDKAMRTQAFANLDLWTNILTLFTQALVTGRIIKWIGLPATLVLLPTVTIAGFAGLQMHPGLTMLMWFQVIRRSLHYSVDRPAAEVLYTVLGPDEKYKSKSFIDTFVYRAGDMAAGWIPKMLGYAAGAPAWLGIGVAALWAVVALVLGVSQKKVAEEKGADETVRR